MTLPCPTCGRPSSRAPENPHRPFCSARCQQLDLAKWLGEDYRVPGPPAPSDPSDPSAG